MILFTHLTMLIAAFLGANLSDTHLDLEARYRDPDVMADHCYAYDDEAEDYHNNYADSWYSWEHCILRDTNGDWLMRDDTHKLSDAEAKELVEQVWEEYTPWMREQFQNALFFPKDGDDPGGDRYRLVLPQEWSPDLPLINKGDKKALEHCEKLRGCAVGPRLNIQGNKRVGNSVWWWADSTRDSYATWTAELTYKSPGRIVTRRQNLFVVLHELAHAINQWQFSWQNEETPTTEHAENERTEGHGYQFRCLALDLYNDYGGNIAEIVPWWEESYVHLNRLCQLIAPGYAQPIADEESAEDEEN